VAAVLERIQLDEIDMALRLSRADQLLLLPHTQDQPSPRPFPELSFRLQVCWAMAELVDSLMGFFFAK
jgi:hypothetical protein